MAETSISLLSSDTLIKLITGGILGAFMTWFLNWLRERRSINSALKAEVERICGVISGQLSFIRGKKGTTIQNQAKDVTWLPFRTPVWDGLVDHLGVLGPQRARDVAKFFGFFGFINDFLALRGEYEKLGKTQEFSERYINLLEDQLKRRPNL